MLRLLCQTFLLLLAVATAGASAAVVINEIHYHSKDKTSPSEFIKLFNPGAAEVSLAGWKFDAGVKFIFPGGKGSLLESRSFTSALLQFPQHLRRGISQAM